jgi:hypothetical protein
MNTFNDQPSAKLPQTYTIKYRDTQEKSKPWAFKTPYLKGILIKVNLSEPKCTQSTRTHIFK